METQSKKLYNKNHSAVERRVRVIARLEAQLLSSVKNFIAPNQPVNSVFTEALSDSDIKRINKEIDALKTRI
jgi:hypothetical protein